MWSNTQQYEDPKERRNRAYLRYIQENQPCSASEILTNALDDAGKPIRLSKRLSQMPREIHATLKGLQGVTRYKDNKWGIWLWKME